MSLWKELCRQPARLCAGLGILPRRLPHRPHVAVGAQGCQAAQPGPGRLRRPACLPSVCPWDWAVLEPQLLAKPAQLGAGTGCSSCVSSCLSQDSRQPEFCSEFKAPTFLWLNTPTPKDPCLLRLTIARVHHDPFIPFLPWGSLLAPTFHCPPAQLPSPTRIYPAASARPVPKDCALCPNLCLAPKKAVPCTQRLSHCSLCSWTVSPCG